MGVSRPLHGAGGDARDHKHTPSTYEHLVQFYDDEHYLHDVLSKFLIPLLRNDESPMGGLVLGRTATAAFVEERLTASNYTCTAVIDRDGTTWTPTGYGARTTASGRMYRRRQRSVMVVDADPALETYVVDGELRIDDFRHAAHEMLTILRPESLDADTEPMVDISRLPIYVYGELVDVVCSRGQHNIALELETVWSAVMASYSINMVCGYRMESLQNSLVGNVFEHICGHHTGVIPTEAYTKLTTTDQKIKMVAALQHKVRTLGTAHDHHWSDGNTRQSLKHRQEFVDVLCHELRNPVSGILGNLELLKMGLDTRQHMLKSNIANLSLPHIAQLQTQLDDDYASIGAIATCAEHMKGVSDDVLSLSKLEDGKVILVKAVFDLKDMITSVVRMFLSAARKKNILLLTELPPEDLHILGDRGRVAQVLINLISNAIKFTSVGSITVSLSCLKAATVGSGQSVFKIAVRDTGCGLTKAEIAALFQRFVQPISTDGGSGLGLYISKNLAELMGGLLYVESQKGKGAVFSLTFQAEPCNVPRQDQTALSSQETMEVDGADDGDTRSQDNTSTSSSEDSRQSNSSVESLTPSTASSTSSSPQPTPTPPLAAHILLVDDNAIILRTLTRIFESANTRPSAAFTSKYSASHLSRHLTISTATNGYECLAKLISSASTPSPIEVIFLDLEMPFLDGLDTMKEITRLTQPYDMGGLSSASAAQGRTVSKFRNVKVVGLTGHGRQEIFDEARRAGMVECLGKPVTRSVLMGVVARLISGEGNPGTSDRMVE